MTVKQCAGVGLCLTVGLVGLSGQERVDLTSPIVLTNSAYTVNSVVLGFATNTISVGLTGSNGESVVCAYSANTTPTGNTLLVALQKANLSSAYAANATTGSLKQRIFHRLVVMGEAASVCGVAITGSLAGSVP